MNKNPSAAELVAQGLIPMFVYGTLRPRRKGLSSWGMTGDEPVISNAYITGGLWFVSGYGSYPVAKLDVAGRIQGDIIFYEEDSWAYQRINDVEVGAGYELREVTANFVESEDDINEFIATGEFQSITVNAWHWLYEVDDRVAVPGNNWLRAVSEERRINR
jgi:gamma-glutamylcyclotransferase (GGCT)/AIG2-like uncharacterized protein YtfP